MADHSYVLQPQPDKEALRRWLREMGVDQADLKVMDLSGLRTLLEKETLAEVQELPSGLMDPSTLERCIREEIYEAFCRQINLASRHAIMECQYALVARKQMNPAVFVDSMNAFMRVNEAQKFDLSKGKERGQLSLLREGFACPSFN
ncbi:hypothetical protein WJX73_007990 [Symbiochloris irregularis]|uniref:Uncharacterized protein n=1 Tax=Symbiochloris irregularis TaxID=706552 RepID=A0AAW1PRM9_9CHLO